MQEDRNDRRDYDDIMKIVFLGDPKVGKSAFLTQFTDNEFSENYIPGGSMEADFSGRILTKTKKRVKLNIWNASGNSKSQERRAFYKGSAGIVIFLDGTKSLDENKDIFEKWIKEKNCEFAPDEEIFVVLTKSDLVAEAKSTEVQIKKMVGDRATFLGSASAKTGENVNNIMLQMTEKLMAKPKPLTERIAAALIRCLQDSYNESNSNEGSRSSLRSALKYTTILYMHGLEDFRDDSIEENVKRIQDYPENLDPNQVGTYLRGLLNSKAITQPRHWLSFGSTIKDDLQVCYNEWKKTQEIEDIKVWEAEDKKITELADALTTCINRCGNHCEFPKNNPIDSFVKNSRYKIIAILHAHGIENVKPDQLTQAFVQQYVPIWSEMIRDYISKNDFNSHLESLASVKNITQGRGNRPSTLNQVIKKLQAEEEASRAEYK